MTPFIIGLPYDDPPPSPSQQLAIKTLVARQLPQTLVQYTPFSRAWGVLLIDVNIFIIIVVHAEVNAIMHKTCISLEGCTLYTTLFPCNECVKVIIQAGITTIYYLRGEDETKKCYVKASIKLLDIAGYHPFCPKPSTRKRARSDSSSDQDTISKCRKLESESESGDHEKECLKP